ncbi:KDGP aldolase, partial [Salmonella enterica subsp. enterica serovar Kentucky]|nr:KDGP aldolase [Salmonella enterica subsp. enterica serovar Kentucky]
MTLIEPTGGISLDNFGIILQTCLEAGVPRVMPHVYSSIIDPHGIKLPDFLSFFGGKRFVPIATGFFCLVLAAIFGYVWPPVQHG